MPQPRPGRRVRVAPVCRVNSVNEAAVGRLRPLVDQLEGVADVFKALADDTRVKVVYALGETELCVCDVAAVIGSSKAVASYHLRLLHHLGLAEYRREGKMVYYRLADPHIGNLVREVLKHLKRVSGPVDPADFIWDKNGGALGEA